VKTSIHSLLDAPLLGGWEVQLAAITPDNVFHGVQLTVRERRRPAHHSLVSDIRDFSAVRQEILASLLNFLDDRFSADASVKLEPLAQIDQNVSDDQLKDCHESLVPDMDLCQFCLEYRETANTVVKLKVASDPAAALRHILQSGAEMTELSTALARFLSHTQQMLSD